ncbi:MAG: GNAT family N-acetyltransferase [Thermoplasmata archaeon]|nr:GNAT family N-acetyltransferase [Thermoplasmata archaeon]
MAPVPTVTVRLAGTRRQVEVARALFLEYRAWLVEHREVTAFADSVLARGLLRMDQEIADLPGKYSPPRGALFVAFADQEPIGCAALRPWDEYTAELKRLFVRTSARTRGVGRRLTARALEKAHQLGVRRVILDTLPGMTGAISLYRTMGFQAIPAYWPNPVASALYFEYRFDDAIYVGGNPPLR